MKIGFVDFNQLTKSYKVYVDGVSEIESVKESFIKKIEPFKKEMNSILISFSSGIFINGQTKEQLEQRAGELKELLFNKNEEINETLRKMISELNEKCYLGLKKIVDDWAEERTIDIVLNNTDAIYYNKNIDITDYIVTVMKDKNVYVELDKIN